MLLGDAFSDSCRLSFAATFLTLHFIFSLQVYRFDPADDSGEVIYETTRWDARQCCRDDSFLGLRFPASDIPRQARELFMKNTLRFVYDVHGKDYPLYPSKIRIDAVDGEEKYTDLSMCRLRGSSYIHLVRTSCSLNQFYSHFMLHFEMIHANGT
jgi:hypothetical protein